MVKFSPWNSQCSTKKEKSLSLRWIIAKMERERKNDKFNAKLSFRKEKGETFSNAKGGLNWEKRRR